MSDAGPRAPRSWPALRRALPGALAALLLFHGFVRLSRPLDTLLGLAGSAALLAALAAALLWDRATRRPIVPRLSAVTLGAAVALGTLAAWRGHQADLLAAALAGLAWLHAGTWRGALQAVAMTLGVHGVIFRVTLAPTPYTALQRFAGWTGDPNDAAGVALLALVPSLWRLTDERRSQTALDSLALALGATAVALTQSRLALSLLALLVALRLAEVLRARPRLALVGLGAAATGVALLPSRFWFRFFRLLEGKDLGMRERMLDAAWSAFREHPWAGAGVGRFPELAGGLAPHSAVLEAMAEGGLLQLALTLGGAAAALWATRRAEPDARALTAVALLLAAVAPIDPRVLAISVVIGLASSNQGPALAYPSRSGTRPAEEPPPG